MKLHAVLVGLALFGCGGKSEEKQAGDQPAGGDKAGQADKADNQATPPPAAEETLDVCAFAKREDVEAVIGKLESEPELMKRQGSLLGQCTYTGPNVATGVVSARPAGEYDATVKYSGEGTEIAGLGEKAVHTKKAGVQIKLAGKSYFLVVFVIDGAKGMNAEKSEALAKAVVAGAK